MASIDPESKPPGLHPRLFAQFTPGEAKPWRVAYRGIEYPGEVVLADSWRAELGEISEEDVHFRIVLLSRHQEVPRESIRDRRIAICMPAELTDKAKRIMGRYLALKERAEACLTEADRESLRIREGRIERELLREEALMYAAGSILCQGAPTIDPAEAFSAPDNEKRLSLIACALLAAAYPALPIDPSAVGKTISYADVGNVFKGFFHNPDAPESKRALGDFAVVLGLAKPDAPSRFDPSGCDVFQIIRDKLEQHRGDLPARELYRELGDNYGLTNPLITLYLLCFVRYARPSVELHLNPAHRLFLRSGETPPGGRLTSALIPQVWWTKGIERAFDRLCYSREPLWNLALPYTSLIREGLKPVTRPGEVEGQERLLLEELRGLGRSIDEIRVNLELLSRGLGETPDRGILESLERLFRIAKARDYLDVYTVAQDIYTSSQSLADDLSLCRRLSGLREITPELLGVKSYLDKVVLRRSDEELAMDRVSILGQLNMGNVLSNLHLWPSVRAMFDWFRSRYRRIYLAHHQEYHHQMASLRARLEKAELEVNCLKRLNSIVELGEPLGTELFSEYARLLEEVKPCSLWDGGEVSLEPEPTCASCRLVLTQEPPTREVDHFFSRLERALKQQQRRLSSEAIRQILAQGGWERVDQFIKIVQASDLSPLVNVMDDEMVGFIRRLLVEARVYTRARPVLRELAERFPVIEEGQIDTVVSEFASLLRKTFEETREENLDKRVQLTLE